MNNDEVLEKMNYHLSQLHHLIEEYMSPHAEFDSSKLSRIVYCSKLISVAAENMLTLSMILDKKQSEGK